jgi:RNA polymerase sigma factor (sigma-70 family)
MRDEDAFTQFVVQEEPRLRRALVARFGPEVGQDALSEGLAYAWQHWSRVSSMENPAGYVYRVSQSRYDRRRDRSAPVFSLRAPDRIPEVEPRLAEALDKLPHRQREVALLVHGFGWSHAEVADLLELSTSTVETHLARAMARLRSILGVNIDA